EGYDDLLRKSNQLLTRNLGDGLVLPPDAALNAFQKQISLHVIKEKLLSVAANVGNVHDGALATYAADYFALGQQGAMLVDKILKGAKPADLPIQQPSKLKLVINLKTTKAIGLKIPKEILLRADEVIE
ncbi:MAG: ABC transporter substrate-binding protein, partial [Deltaproteobacteria bacterium]|nr:ABC transporter substrate-binding protein [Deltaproteobacteria bacterium]